MNEYYYYFSLILLYILYFFVFKNYNTVKTLKHMGNEPIYEFSLKEFSQ